MEIDRDLVSRLPEQVRAEAARYVAARDLDSLVKLLDEQPPDPVVLLCVAWARTRWASEVMVDRLLPDAELALAQVGQARRAGARARDADPVERFVRTMLDHERRRQRAERLSERTAAAGPGGLNADQLRSRAHRAWDAHRYDEAAGLFRDAALRQLAEGRPGEFNDEIRAALCLAKAGREKLRLVGRAHQGDRAYGVRRYPVEVLRDRRHELPQAIAVSRLAVGRHQQLDGRSGVG